MLLGASVGSQAYNCVSICHFYFIGMFYAVNMFFPIIFFRRRIVTYFAFINVPLFLLKFVSKCFHILGNKNSGKKWPKNFIKNHRKEFKIIFLGFRALWSDTSFLHLFSKTFFSILILDILKMSKMSFRGGFILT